MIEVSLRYGFPPQLQEKNRKIWSLSPIRKSPPGKKPGELPRSTASLTTSTLDMIEVPLRYGFPPHLQEKNRKSWLLSPKRKSPPGKKPGELQPKIRDLSWKGKELWHRVRGKQINKDSLLNCKRKTEKNQTSFVCSSPSKRKSIPSKQKEKAPSDKPREL